MLKGGEGYDEDQEDEDLNSPPQHGLFTHINNLPVTSHMVFCVCSRTSSKG